MIYQASQLAALSHSTSEFPSVIVNDLGLTTVDQAIDWAKQNVDVLKAQLSATGALLFREFPITDAQSYDSFFSAFGYPNFTYQESLSNAVRINHTEYVFTANEAPKHIEIFLHNEMAQTPIFPGIISLFCESASETGGATEICRCDWLYEKLQQVAPEQLAKLEQVGVRYTTHMPAEDKAESGQGRSWKGTLSVDNKAQAEAKLQDLGYRWTWNDDGSLTAQSPALDAVKTLKDGRKVFFNQIIAAYKGWKGGEENPSSVLCLGDESEFDPAFLQQIYQQAENIAFDINWQDQDVAIVDNYLAMHGRRPYQGDRPRKVLVVLGADVNHD